MTVLCSGPGWMLPRFSKCLLGRGGIYYVRASQRLIQSFIWAFSPPCLASAAHYECSFCMLCLDSNIISIKVHQMYALFKMLLASQNNIAMTTQRCSVAYLMEAHCVSQYVMHSNFSKNLL